MSFKKIATTAAVITSVLAANLSPLATAASAGDWRRYDNDGYAGSTSYDRFRNDRHNDRYDRNDRYNNRYEYFRRDDHRHHSGKDVARGVAIGLGVLALGAILANSADRHR